MVQRILSTAIFTGLLLLGVPARAEDSMSLARKFVELLRYDEQYDGIHNQCIRSAIDIPPEKLLVDDPDRFFGIRPGSKCWEKVIEAYQAYWEAICNRPTKAEFLNSLAAEYGSRLSVPQLETAMSFYSSDIGQRLVTAHKAAAAEAQTVFAKAYAEQTPIALIEFNRRLRTIAEERDSKGAK